MFKYFKFIKKFIFTLSSLQLNCSSVKLGWAFCFKLCVNI